MAEPANETALVVTLIGVAGAVPSATTVAVKVAPMATGLVVVRGGVQGHVATHVDPDPEATSVAQPAIVKLLALNATVPDSLAVAVKVNGAPVRAEPVGCVRTRVGVVADAAVPSAAAPPRAKAPAINEWAILRFIMYVLLVGEVT
jgi:hypothetical protein